MLDRETSARLDQDPNLDRPLRPETKQFLQTYRASKEFEYRYDGNLHLSADLNHLSDIKRREAVWSRAFVDRLFTLQTIDEASRLLEPWVRWGEISSQIWAQYWGKGGDKDEIHTRYQECQRQFDEVEIPPAIKEYQDDLLDKELRSLAHWEIFGLTRGIRESVDLFEGATKPVSLDTIFRAQRIMNQPVVPVGGLEPDIVNKPCVRRIEQVYNLYRKSYIAFDFDGEPADSATEDPSSEEEWQRWSQIKVGTHIKYLREDPQTKQKTIEAGVVHGFDLLGAGDAMILEPSVADIGIIVVNEKTRFFQCPLVSDIRLDSEEFTQEELTAKEQPKPVDVVIMRPLTGEVTQQTFGSMEEATEAVRKQIAQEFSSQE